MKFGEKIILLRKARGLSQAKLGALVGVAGSTIYKWESGKSEPNVEKLRELLIVFQVPAEFLLREEPEGVGKIAQAFQEMTEEQRITFLKYIDTLDKQ